MNKKLILRKIISGGQQGADFGGLLAGKDLNLETGGTAPKEYRTENGSNYKLIEFGLKEHSSFEYPPRTKQNVQDSDGTIIFGRLESPGSILTYNLCKKFNKPYWFVSQVELIENKNANKESFILWLIENQIQILNVAGNRESKNLGIEQNVRNYLFSALIQPKTKVININYGNVGSIYISGDSKRIEWLGEYYQTHEAPDWDWEDIRVISEQEAKQRLINLEKK